MNLADIRKKAQADAQMVPTSPQWPGLAESQGSAVPAAQPGTSATAAAPVVTAVADPAPAPAPEAPAPAPAETAPVPAETAPAPAEAAPAPVLVAQVPAVTEPLRQGAMPVPVYSDWVDLQTQPGFDPAAVILQGRQSACLEETAQEAEQADASQELLCFRVATEDYAISIMDIKEIIRPREVTEVPRVPAFVRGILSLRGIIIPIFDMRVRLGLAEGVRSERERIVVVKRQGGFCGVLVDEVVQVVRIAETAIEPPPVVLEGIDREFVAGIGRVGGRMLILLDMEKVLDVGLL